MFTNKYSYGNETYDFKVRVMNPILEGNVYATQKVVTLNAIS